MVWDFVGKFDGKHFGLLVVSGLHSEIVVLIEVFQLVVGVLLGVFLLEVEVLLGVFQLEVGVVYFQPGPLVGYMVCCLQDPL